MGEAVKADIRQMRQFGQPIFAGPSSPERLTRKAFWKERIAAGAFARFSPKMFEKQTLFAVYNFCLIFKAQSAMIGTTRHWIWQRLRYACKL